MKLFFVLLLSALFIVAGYSMAFKKRSTNTDPLTIFGMIICIVGLFCAFPALLMTVTSIAEWMLK